MKLIPTLLLCALLCIARNSFATIYTTQQSGLYSSSSTWKNGLKPPATLTGGDIVEILPAYTITLDSNLEFKDNSQLRFQGGGVLKSASTEYIIMHGTTRLKGNPGGSVIVARFDSYGSATSEFNGVIEVDNLNMYDNAIFTNSGTKVIIHQSLRLPRGKATFSGCKVELDTAGGNKVLFLFEGGELNIIGSTIINLGLPYNARYTSSVYGEINDPIIKSSGLHNLEIYLPAKDTLRVGSFEFDGQMLLGSGVLEVNKGSTVTMGIRGKIRYSNGYIDMDGCNLIMNSKETDAGVLRMSNRSLDTLRMSGGLNTVFRIDSNIYINKSLQLNMGKLELHWGVMFLDAACKVSYSPGYNSYVIPGPQGYIRQDIPALSTNMYPVGTHGHFAPVLVENINNAVLKGQVVGLRDEVLDEPYVGSPIHNTLSLVKATWSIWNDDTAGVCRVQPFWDAGMEMNGFTRSYCALARWENNTGWTSVVYNTSYDTLNLRTVPSVQVKANSLLIIADANALSINDLPETEQILAYPNPVKDVLRLNYKGRVSIYNMQGQMVMDEVVDNSIDVRELPQGVYRLRFADGSATTIQKL